MLPMLLSGCNVMSDQDDTRAKGGAPPMLPPPTNAGGAAPLDNNGMPNLSEPIVVPSMPSPTSPPHTGRTLVGVLQGGTGVVRRKAM